MYEKNSHGSNADSSSTTIINISRLCFHATKFTEAFLHPGVNNCILLLKCFLFFFQETRTLAEIAKAELDGTLLSNRPIRIRFATHSAALKVRNLLPIVTNELLEQVNL